MKLYNTLTRQTDEVEPLDGKTIRIYSCGPTVYDNVHIGNLSSFIFVDTLRRSLQIAGHKVRHVMNLTDVDDKTINRSREASPDLDPAAALQKLTSKYSRSFLADTQAVGNDNSAIEFVKATDSITAMQELISRLHEEGIAYITDDGIYFSIEKYAKKGKKYGQLTEVTAASTNEARIQNDEYDKASVHDFALWKKQKDGEPGWDFEIGGQNMKGRPGWHIECSAMSRQALGQPFDIHTGGVDLIFPHHENEIAQSTAAQDDPVYAAVFAHNEHLLVDGQKMSKSLNNFYTLEDITAKGFDPLAFRLLILQAHYRRQAHFSWENLQAAQNRLKALQNFAALRWQTIGTGTASIDYAQLADHKVHDPLSDDLNTPQVLANISAIQTQIESSLVPEKDLDGFDKLLKSIDELLGLKLTEVTDITDGQKQLITQRQQAKDDKDWPYADRLRGQLAEQGIGLRDTPRGAIWFRL